MIASLLCSLTAYCLLWGKLPQWLLLTGSLLLFLAVRWLRKGGPRDHGGFLSIDVYAQKSRLNNWHSGLKICFCLLCALLCVGFNSVLVSLFVAAGMVGLTVGPGGIPVRYYLLLLTTPVTFLLLGTAAVLVEISPVPLGLLDLPVGARYLCVTPASQRGALLLICRSLGAVSCLYLLGLTTPMGQIIGALRRARLPALVIELMFLIYRYIFVMLETQRQMQSAAQARLGDWGVGAWVRTLCATSWSLLFLSFHRASGCFEAMEARCYEGEACFLEKKQRVRGVELALGASYLAALVLLGYWARRLGV